MDKPSPDPPKKPDQLPPGYMQPPPDAEVDSLGRPWPEVKVSPRKARRRQR